MEGRKQTKPIIDVCCGSKMFWGSNKKYQDMFNMSLKDDAKIFDTEAEAQKVRSVLKKGGYNFIVKSVGMSERRK